MQQDDVSTASQYVVGDMYNTNTNQWLIQESKTYQPTYLFIIVSVIAECLNSIFALFGVGANMMNCLVFYHQGLGDRMNLCLFSLALSDLLFVVSCAYFSIAGILRDQQLIGDGVELCLKFESYFYGINLAFRTTSGLYIMVIAIERCVCVTFPLQAPTVVTTRSIGQILLLFAILPQLGFACQPLKYDVIKTEIAETSQWILVPSQLYISHKSVIDMVTFTILSISIPLITFSVVSLATTITVLQLVTAAAWRRKTSSGRMDLNSQQMALTKMLVTASCVYIITMIPFTILKLVRLCDEQFSPYGSYYKLYQICARITNGFFVINSSLTFFIYYSRSSKYKNTMRKLLLF